MTADLYEIVPDEDAPTSRHSWIGEKRVPACDAPDHCDRTERGCGYCGCVLITVHPPNGIAFNKWRDANGVESIITRRPPCHPVVSGEVEAQ